MMSMGSRAMIALAGLAGATGIAAEAAQAHIGGGNLHVAGQFLMIHAPAFLAVGLGGRPLADRVVPVAVVLALGLVLFCGDLAVRDFTDQAMFPYAAPIGGSLLILGWVAVGLTALLPRRAASLPTASRGA